MSKELNVFERNASKVVLLAVVAASFSSILVKLIDAPSMTIGFYRLTFAMPFFACLALGWHREELKKITRKQLGGCMLAGVFLTGHFFCWFTSVDYTTIASATVIGITHPIIILIITTLVFKEKTNKKAVVGVLVAFLGASIISAGDYSFSGTAILGDFMAFGAALFMALYFICGCKLRSGIPAAVYVFLVFGTCWICFSIGMVATNTPFIGYSAMDYVWILVMTLICQIGGHALFNWSLGYVSPLYVATWENGEAILATIFAAILFHEIPTIWQIVGGVIAICGLLYYNLNEKMIED